MTFIANISLFNISLFKVDLYILTNYYYQISSEGLFVHSLLAVLAQIQKQAQILNLYVKSLITY